MTRPGDRPPGSRTIPDPQRVREEERRRKLPPEELSMEEGHELRDMRVRQVVAWLALLTASVVVLIVLVTVFEAASIGHVGPLQAVINVVPRVTPPPQPRLEQENGEILGALHKQEDQVLNNYTWIDQAAGTVSLPIDRAIELTAQRGLPVQAPPAGQATPQATPRVTLPEGSSSGRTLESLP